MLKEKLSEDLKNAMRAKDEARLRTIRSLRAALLEREIAERQGGQAELSAEQEVAVLQKQAKQRRDAIEQYQAANREDLLLKEQEELRIIEEYLPQQLGDDEIRKVVHEVVMATGAASPQDMGKVMGEIMRLLKGKADGRRIQQIVQESLTGRTTRS